MTTLQKNGVSYSMKSSALFGIGIGIVGLLLLPIIFAPSIGPLPFNERRHIEYWVWSLSNLSRFKDTEISNKSLGVFVAAENHEKRVSISISPPEAEFKLLGELAVIPTNSTKSQQIEIKIQGLTTGELRRVQIYATDN